MSWDQRSRRRSELPRDWPIIRRDILQRDRYTCRIQGERCTSHATEVDHIGNRHDHSRTNLRSACSPCHSERTTEQGHNAMRTVRAKATHPREQHPGLR